MRLSPGFLIPLLLLFAGSPAKEALLFLGAVLLHESGHLLALRRFGCQAKGLTLSLAGAVLSTQDALLPYRKEIKVYLSGPLANGVGCLFSFYLLRLHFTRMGMLFFSFNALLALFNLLPLRGLDGAGALKALLCLRGEEEQAERVCLFLHRLFSLLLFAGGVLLLWNAGNPSLLILMLSLLGTGEEKKTKRKKATTSS